MWQQASRVQTTRPDYDAFFSRRFFAFSELFDRPSQELDIRVFMNIDLRSDGKRLKFYKVDERDAVIGFSMRMSLPAKANAFQRPPTSGLSTLWGFTESPLRLPGLPGCAELSLPYFSAE
jgi:hypothetical protein